MPEPGRADLAQTPETAAPRAPEATNPARAPEHASEPDRAAYDELRARLIHDLDRALNVSLDDPEINAAEQWYVDEFTVDCSTHTLLRVLARDLLAAGWRPANECAEGWAIRRGERPIVDIHRRHRGAVDG